MTMWVNITYLSYYLNILKIIDLQKESNKNVFNDWLKNEDKLSDSNKERPVQMKRKYALVSLFLIINMKHHISLNLNCAMLKNKKS